MPDSGDLSRRSFVRAGALALAALAARPKAALAAQRAAGPGDDEIPAAVRKVLEARFGKRQIQPGHVKLDVPEVAPDSREVPVFVDTDLPMEPAHWVRAIHLIVDFNPDIYVAGFTLSPALGAASIDTRIKMRRSSHVRAVVESNTGELWIGSKFVYTTLNGCV